MLWQVECVCVFSVLSASVMCVWWSLHRSGCCRIKCVRLHQYDTTLMWKYKEPGLRQPQTSHHQCVCVCDRERQRERKREIQASTNTAPLLPSLTDWMQRFWLEHGQSESIQCWTNLAPIHRWTCFRNMLSLRINILRGCGAWISSVNTSIFIYRC